MPIYEYKCKSCDENIEALQSFSDKPLVICPFCNDSSLVKQISAANFTFSDRRANRKQTLKVSDEIEKPYRSPIDGSVIRTEQDLRKHNQRNKVTNDLDSLREKKERQLQRQRNPGVKDKKHLTESLVKSYDFVEQNPHLYPKDRAGV